MSVLGWLVEFAWLLMASGLAIWAPAPEALAWVLFASVLSVSFWRSRRPALPDGSLPLDRGLLLVGLAILGMKTRVQFTGQVADWWPVVPAGLLLLVGTAFVWRDRKERRLWTAIRKELLLVMGVLLVTAAASAFVSRGLVVFASDLPIRPGRLDFLLTMAVFAAVWFGLDASLRRSVCVPYGGLPGRLWSHRHRLLLVSCALVVCLRVEWSFIA